MLRFAIMGSHKHMRYHEKTGCNVHHSMVYALSVQMYWKAVRRRYVED